MLINSKLQSQQKYNVPDLQSQPRYNVPDLQSQQKYNIPDLQSQPRYNIPDLPSQHNVSTSLEYVCTVHNEGCRVRCSSKIIRRDDRVLTIVRISHFRESQGMHLAIGFDKNPIGGCQLGPVFRPDIRFRDKNRMNIEHIISR